MGDTGCIEAMSADGQAGGKKVFILDTKKENNLIIHLVKELPEDLTASFKAEVDTEKRRSTASNHSATHLMHQALRENFRNPCGAKRIFGTSGLFAL